MIAGIAASTNAWFRNLNLDEENYYAPAIQYVSRSLPVLPLRNYPFPAPPLALWIQGVVAATFGDFTSVRIFSSVCAVLLAAYLLLGTDSKAKLPPLGIIALLSFPFFLWNAFTIKEHTFTLACLLIGMERWCKAEETDSGGNFRASSLFLTAAALSNQFCAPLCASLCLDGLLQMRNQTKCAKTAILFSAFPLGCLGLLMLYWGGKQPPFYVDLLPGAAFTGHGRLAQFMLGAISVGAWLGAPLFEYRLHLKSFLIALVPSVFLVWISRLYSFSGDFRTVGQGPISSVLSAACNHTPSLMILISGALAAFAVSFWIRPGVDAPWTGRCRILIAAYLSITAVAVPYLFESYYLLLIMPLLFVVLRKNEIFVSNRIRTSIYLAGIVGAGIVYSVCKLKKLG